MALADSIRALRDRTLADLNATHDYYYERPTGWFAYLNEKVKLGCPTEDEVDRIAEAMASRDVLVHNRGIAG
jgi:hypothetical protein